MKYLGMPLLVTCLKRNHFQPVEDKVDAKLVPWFGKLVTMDDRSTLVKVVLDVPMEFPMNIDSIRFAFLCDQVSKECKVNWESVCKPEDKCGL
jgi:hypothetical protein